jgi:hypothetical protein
LRSITIEHLLDIDNNGYRNSKNGIGHAVRTDERVRGDVPDLAIRAGIQTQCGRNSPMLAPQFFTVGVWDSIHSFAYTCTTSINNLATAEYSMVPPGKQI